MMLVVQKQNKKAAIHNIKLIVSSKNTYKNTYMSFRDVRKRDEISVDVYKVDSVGT